MNSTKNTSRGLVRIFAMSAAVAGLVVASVATISLADARTATEDKATSATAPAATRGDKAAAAAPGLDPGIQRWFLADDARRIRFDNALLKTENEIARGSGGSSCSDLLKATAAVRADVARLKSIPHGGSAIARAYAKPFDEFANAASACVHGDYATARQILGDTRHGAIADFGAAQDSVDEVLDAGK